MKELRVEVPQGYEIDKENSTFECIKFKSKGIKTWNDLCKAGDVSDEKKLSGYWISGYSSDIYAANKLMPGGCSKNVFLTEKEAKSSLAMSQISQLMPYYGGAITDEEWLNGDTTKYVIRRNKGQSICTNNRLDYYFLAFRTEEQRDDFLEHNYELVKNYLMLD